MKLNTAKINNIRLQFLFMIWIHRAYASNVGSFLQMPIFVKLFAALHIVLGTSDISDVLTSNDKYN